MPRGPRRNLRPVAERMSHSSSRTSVGQLTDRLARVEQQRHARRPAQPPHPGGGLDQPALRGDVDERDDPRTALQLLLERAQRHLAALVVADHDHDRPGALRDLQQRDVVRRVLGPAGQDPVARLEVERVEGHVPGAGRVLDDRDLVARAAEQAGDAVVGRLDPVVLARGSLVAADPRLQLEVLDHRLQHHVRHQRRAGVVEMDDPLAARTFRRGPLDVDRPREAEASPRPRLIVAGASGSSSSARRRCSTLRESTPTSRPRSTTGTRSASCSSRKRKASSSGVSASIV